MSARSKLASAVLVLGTLVACSSTLSPGAVGVLRYAGRVRGTRPLPLLPPVTDIAGNVYVLNGAIDSQETRAIVGPAGGGWKANCELPQNRTVGVHGWVGYTANEQWYWSGDALIAISGRDGNCHEVLDRDPSTNTDLFFQAVIPAVRDLAQRTTVPAFVQTATDPRPFSALVDLEVEILTNVQPFEPADASDVQFLGVGGLREQARGMVLVQYRRGNRVSLELRGYDGDADLTSLVPVNGGPYGAYAVQGYLQLDDGELVAGLLRTSNDSDALELLTADGAGADVKPVTGMEPVGVHRWGGALWLVGVRDSLPVVAPIGRGGIGAIAPWTASGAVAGFFQGPTAVRDDRSLPSRETTWVDVGTATGAWPFLSAHSMTQHAEGTTLWVFGGPTSRSNSIDFSAFGVAPCGISYP